MPSYSSSSSGDPRSSRRQERHSQYSLGMNIRESLRTSPTSTTKYSMTRDLDEIYGFSHPPNQTKYSMTKNVQEEMERAHQLTIQQGTKYPMTLSDPIIDPFGMRTIQAHSPTLVRLMPPSVSFSNNSIDSAKPNFSKLGDKRGLIDLQFRLDKMLYEVERSGESPQIVEQLRDGINKVGIVLAQFQKRDGIIQPQGGIGVIPLAPIPFAPVVAGPIVGGPILGPILGGVLALKIIFDLYRLSKSDQTATEKLIRLLELTELLKRILIRKRKRMRRKLKIKKRKKEIEDYFENFGINIKDANFLIQLRAYLINLLSHFPESVIITLMFFLTRLLTEYDEITLTEISTKIWFQENKRRVKKLLDIIEKLKKEISDLEEELTKLIESVTQNKSTIPDFNNIMNIIRMAEETAEKYSD